MIDYSCSLQMQLQKKNGHQNRCWSIKNNHYNGSMIKKFEHETGDANAGIVILRDIKGLLACG